MTKQRALIYQIVKESSRHLTAEEIFALALAKMPSIVRATVYNNLNALTEQGLIRRVKAFGQPDRYDRNLSEHDHLICEGCGKISDITIGDLKQELSERAGIEITGYELNLHYLCPACRSRAGRKRK